MNGERDTLQWLRDANADWAARAERERVRADSAERWAADEQAERVRARRALARWRWRALIGWAWLVIQGALDLTHWPYLAVALPAVLGAVAVNEILRRRPR